MGRKDHCHVIHCTNQSINILFYVCSHQGDIRQKQKHIIIIYTNFPTGLWTIDLTMLVILHCTTGRIKAKNSAECLSFRFSNKAKYCNHCWLENDPQSVKNEVVVFCFFLLLHLTPVYWPWILITTVYITIVRMRACVYVREAGSNCII